MRIFHYRSCRRPVDAGTSCEGASQRKLAL